MPNPATAAYTWFADGFAVNNFDPSKMDDHQVTPLEGPLLHGNTVSFAWCAGGNDQMAGASNIDGKSLVAWFNVQQPEELVTAAVNPYTGGYGDHGVNPVGDGGTVQFCWPDPFVTGITFGANNDNMYPDDFAGFEANFEQVINNSYGAMCLPSGKRETVGISHKNRWPWRTVRSHIRLRRTASTPWIRRRRCTLLATS